MMRQVEKKANQYQKVPFSPPDFHPKVSWMNLVKFSTGTSYTVYFYKLTSVS